MLIYFYVTGLKNISKIYKIPVIILIARYYLSSLYSVFQYMKSSIIAVLPVQADLFKVIYNHSF